jgi:hypothetical protein
VACVALGAMLLGCTADPRPGATTGATRGPPRTLRVPGDAATIQGAVDLARSGDLILVAPGTYHEEVVVEKVENITIRGLDRNRTVLDGEHRRDNGVKVFRNGVALENLTIRNYTSNGAFFTGDFDSHYVLTGYRASYVTVHNNGDYGLYAFNATKGVFDHDLGSGHPDAGFYVGQCDPCDAVITDSVAERNMLGFTGTNASGVTIVRSEFRDNLIGVVPNSNDGEKLAPQRRATIAGNWVHDNGMAAVPVSDPQYHLVWGNGILVTGGEDDVITRNRVEGNARGGIGIMMWPFRTGRLPAFAVAGNHVTDNVALGNARDPAPFGDLWLWTARESQGAQGNCFAGNTFATSTPAAIEAVAPCAGAGGAAIPGLDVGLLRAGPAGIDHRTVPAPAEQPQLPDAATAPAAGALPAALPPPVDLSTMTVPTAPRVG